MAESKVTKPTRICQVVGCGNKHKAKNFCGKHYMQVKVHGKPIEKEELRALKPIKLCSIDGCNEKHWGKEYCLSHYNQARGSGELGFGVCRTKNCGLPAISKELCFKHYNQMNNKGYVYRSRYEPNIFEVDGDICFIHTFDNNGNLKNKVKIDVDDIEKVRPLKWCVGNHGYAENVKTKTLLHRIIIESIPVGLEIDHINRDRLDNRKSNLRIVNRAQNAINSSLCSTNKTGFKGVCWVKRCNKYVVQLNKNGVRVYYGHFDDKVEAAKMYDIAAIEFFGDFAATNERLGLL
jgi:hypothetical protein